MIPKKRKDIVAKIAPSLPYESDMIDDVVLEFYRYVQGKMRDCSERRINCPRLGVFVMIDKKVDSKISKLEKMINETDIEQCTFNQYESHLTNRDLLLQLRKMREVFKFEKEKKQKLTKIRRDGDVNRNLEK